MTINAGFQSEARVASFLSFKNDNKEFLLGSTSNCRIIRVWADGLPLAFDIINFSLCGVCSLEYKFMNSHRSMVH